LEAYANGTPAPSAVTKEVDMSVVALFLLAKPDLSKTEVVKAYAYSIVPPQVVMITGKRQPKSRKGLSWCK
jgi:hypothetical protein